MISETQKTTGGMEKGGPWGKHACFYSSGFGPKLRDTQENKRENKAAKVRRKCRKKKGIDPTPMAKPRPKTQKTEKGKGKGKGKEARTAE